MAHKIIHVVLGKANPNRMNGVNKVVNRLATTQVELGHDVEVWGITKDTTHNYPERNYETILFQDQQFKFLLDAQLKKAIENLNKETVTFHLHGGYLLQFFSLSRVGVL